MKTFEERQIEIIKYCDKPKTAKQIMTKFELGEHSIYRYLRYLRNDGYLVKQKNLSASNNQYNFYVATGKPYVKKGSPYTAYPTGHTICGVRF